jgi:hypothetical protein
MGTDRDSLRHLLAALAYRTTRAIENAPESFAHFEGAGRQPVQILAHMGDLLDWTLSIAEGNQRWKNSTPLPWEEEKARFYEALRKFDKLLASDAPVHGSLDRLTQGPIADALTHVGQLAMMRRMAGCATRGENFYVAEVTTGKVGPEQPAPIRTF